MNIQDAAKALMEGKRISRVKWSCSESDCKVLFIPFIFKDNISMSKITMCDLIYTPNKENEDEYILGYTEFHPTMDDLYADDYEVIEWW